MRALPDETDLRRFLSRARARLIVVRALEGLAAGALVAAVLLMAGLTSAQVLASLVLLLTALRVALGASWRFGWWRNDAVLAATVEQQTPVGRNLLVTAAELIDGGQAEGYMHSLVVRRASAISREIDLTKVFPVTKALSFALAGGVLLLVAAALPDRDSGSLVSRPVRVPGLPAIHTIDVIIAPPSYSGQPATTLRNPARIEALAGSQIAVRLSATAADVTLETISGTKPLDSSGGSWQVTLLADADGYIALEPRDSTGARGPRHLIGLVVTPDQPPRVTLTAPGRDLFFSDVPSSLPVAISAEDDIALGTLTLRYTAVSGSGERFTFVENEVPLTRSAPNARSWTASGTWRLDSLALAPGDMVVYRAIATDRRPGSRPVESDSYVLEVVTPGAIAAEGFAADDERDRYAVSQQMVILKTERLLARRTSMPLDSLADAAATLAAEQRQVRAEFVFMMGGHVEDEAAETAGTLEVNEVAEAEAEGDILAGRLQNQGRVEMMRAIRSMSRASTALTDVNLEQALRDERVALDNLMRAFSRTRFILRALTQREAIDLERRLSGTLAMASGASGGPVSAKPSNHVVALRRLMADVAALAHDSTRASSGRAVDGALALLRADPRSDTLRALAVRIQEVAGRALTRQAGSQVREVDSLVRVISALAAAAMPLASPLQPGMGSGRLSGAWRDAQRGGRSP